MSETVWMLLYDGDEDVDWFDSREDAEKAVRRYEADDKARGQFRPYRYEVEEIEIERDEEGYIRW